MSRFKLILALLLAATYSTLVAWPFFALATNDRGNPIKVAWQDDEHNLIDVRYDYSRDFKRFYQATRLPIQPNLWQVIALALVAGFLCCCFRPLLLNLTNEGSFILISLAYQITLIALVCIYCVCHYHHHDVTNRLQAAITDPELAQKAISHTKAYCATLTAFTLFFLIIPDLLFLSLSDICDSYIVSPCQELGKRYKTSIKKQITADINKTHFLWPENHIEQSDYSFKWRWLPFPSFYPMKLSGRTITWSDLVENITRQVKDDSATDLITRELKLSLLSVFTQSSQAASTKVAETAQAHLNQDLARRVNLAAAQQEGISVAGAKALLQQVSDHTLGRFQQDITASLSEATSLHLKEFKHTALQFLRDRDTASQIRLAHQDIALPDGTKFCLQKGNTTVFVVEQKPMCRTVFVSGSLLDQDAHPGNGEENTRHQDGSFYLSFPYLIYVIRFNQGEPTHLKIFYRTEPITNINDQLLSVNLPNVWDSNNVCLRFPDEATYANMTDGVHQIISHFWQSQFNNDLTYKYTYQNPVGRFTQWAQRTQTERSDFVLTAQWHKLEKTLLDKVTELLDIGYQPDMTPEKAVRESLTRALIDLCDVITDVCDKTTVDNRYHLQIANQLSEYLVSLAKAATNQVTEHLTEAGQEASTQAQTAFDTALQQGVNKAVADQFISHVVSETLAEGKVSRAITQAFN